METLNPGTYCIDLEFQGRPGVIATGAIDTPDGVLLVDPGPASCLPRLRAELQSAGIALTDLCGVLLTHVHLDHGGASGTLAREHPGLTVYVHERGATHLVDPSKLVASAARIYGDAMDRLWGEFAPVPAARVRALAGGETLAFGARRIDVAYAPGHAWHHLAYRDRETGIAYTGDVAGIRIGDRPYVLPPTPPPDIDLETWRKTLALIRAWAPEGVFITHFGLKRDAAAHLDMVADELAAWGRVSRDLLDTADGPEQARRFVEGVTARIAERVGPDMAAAYSVAVSLEHCWMGLARYWNKKLGGGDKAPVTGEPTKGEAGEGERQ
jgi:glyoxylase-like metal-dependent hydrolase (beta-lactamase superfamily II)